MGCHAELVQATGMAIYFCNTASPCQRGTNENTDGPARDYFPKGADLRSYSADYLEAVAQELNGRPRETLGWRTDCFKDELSLATGLCVASIAGIRPSKVAQVGQIGVSFPDRRA